MVYMHTNKNNKNKNNIHKHTNTTQKNVSFKLDPLFAPHSNSCEQQACFCNTQHTTHNTQHSDTLVPALHDLGSQTRPCRKTSCLVGILTSISSPSALVQLGQQVLQI